MSEPSADLIELTQTAELLDVKFLELHAVQGDGLKEQDEVAEVEPKYNLGIQLSADRAQFRIRLRVELGGEFGSLVAEAAAEYARNGFPDDRVTELLMLDYANNVAVMALLPYLRQAVADMSQRVLGAAILMPILQRGSVTFALETPETSH